MEHHHHHHDYHDDHPDDDKNKVRGVGTGRESGRERGEGEILIEVVRKRSRGAEEQRSTSEGAKIFGSDFRWCFLRCFAVSVLRCCFVASSRSLSLAISISRGCDVAIEATPEIERRSID